MWGRSVTGAQPTPSLPFEVNGMATLTSVNDQITDATRSRTHAALGDVLVSLTQSAGISYQNAVNAQQQATLNAQAATTQGVATIYGIDTAPTGLATKETP
jgi:hypothetical protein